jgi:hypothetical protein
MGDTKKTKKKLQSKLEVIKKLNDDPKQLTDDIYDKYLKDLPSTDKLFGKKIGDLSSKIKRKKDNISNIFEDLIKISEDFLGVNQKRTDPTKLSTKGKIKQNVLDSTKVTLDSSKQIILDNVKRTFFAGDDSVCGTNTTIKTNCIELKPSEFDFLNVLTVNPNSSIGNIVYESPIVKGNKQKVDRNVYDAFTNPSGYQFDSVNNNTLFNMNWDTSNQKFDVCDLLQGQPAGNVSITDFFNDYYSTIELPDISGITKNAILLTLQGGDGDNPLFQGSLNNLNRLLSKLFSICGSPQKQQELKQNSTDQFNENDEDVDSYFDFTNVEGIDVDDEDAKLRKVLKFYDCNNFEIPVNSEYIDDFVYLTGKKDLNSLVQSTISKASSNAYDQSDGTIPLINFNLSLMNSFVLNLPKALIMSVMSPKFFLPIVIIYKLVKNNSTLDVKLLMRKLSILFNSIINDLFWLFIREFWRRTKRDLLEYVKKIALKITKNKRKKWVTILTSLISFLITLLEEKIDNCFDLFNIILTTINSSLKGKTNQEISGFLLSFADRLPGYSGDRAFMNISERLQNAGIPLSPLYGESNILPSIIKSIIDGNNEEQDTNGYISGGNKLTVLPVIGPAGGTVILKPGDIKIAGKLM